MKLPESLYFLRPGWWLVHVVAISAVFAAGFFVSRHFAGHGHDTGHGSDPASHAAEHHDHTSPAVLRPIMQQMLTDAVQLQGALSAGDFARAATYADAIAGACDDDPSEGDGALPDSLGRSFAEHDRVLHDTASRLGGALRAALREDALSLNQQLVSTCETCHAQAPAANALDLRVLASFAATLAAPPSPTEAAP